MPDTEFPTLSIILNKMIKHLIGSVKYGQLPEDDMWFNISQGWDGNVFHNGVDWHLTIYPVDSMSYQTDTTKGISIF